jgi:cellulose synthase/poly-beta-1,6-N-acetylglucosamine synthase-like glycosyltransferase
VLTRAIAIGIDVHFFVEQVGRYATDNFQNFNGSGGVLRKKALVEAGGWQSDTLAEDLDSSYRIQLQGYRVLFLRDLTSPEGGIRVVLTNCRRGDWEHAAQYFQGGIAAYRVVPAIVTEILGRISSQGTADDFTVESEEYGTDGVTLRIRTTAEGQPLNTWTWVFDRRNIGWTIREVV